MLGLSLSPLLLSVACFDLPNSIISRLHDFLPALFFFLACQVSKRRLRSPLFLFTDFRSPPMLQTGAPFYPATCGALFPRPVPPQVASPRSLPGPGFKSPFSLRKRVEQKASLLIPTLPRFFGNPSIPPFCSKEFFDPGQL